MLIINAISALEDNYIWILHNDTHAIVVDAGESEPVLDYLNEQKLSLDTILITHHHHDHVGGVADLLAKYPTAQLFAHQAHGVGGQAVDEGDVVQALSVDFQVWRTAGHTDTHLSYLMDMGGQTHVFCADTLFSGGCGRVFTGTMDELYDSMMRFNALPSDTLFYPAHEYTLSNLKFGAYVEPHNEAIGRAILHATDCQALGKPTLPVSLKHEQAVNVFLRVDERHIQDRLMTLGRVSEQADARQTFKALRLLKNEPLPI